MSPESQPSSQSSEEQEEPRETCADIAHSFQLNVGAVRVFNEQIGPVADEHDRGVLERVSARMREVLSEAEGLQGTPEVSESDGENGADHATEGRSGEPEDTQKDARRVEVDAETLQEIAETFISKVVRGPSHGPLLRQGALTTLLSFFEVLISDLIQLCYSMFPGRLSAKQVLTLETLRQLDTTKVEDVEKYLASVEVDDLLYKKSLKDQLAYFAEELDVNIDPLKPELKYLVEISQRRNLLVHNKGIVNRQYLSKVADELIEEYGIEQGDELAVRESYLNAAIDTIYVSGLMLVQLCWRKWDRAATEAADKFVVTHMLYRSLREERFELVRRMAERLKEARYATEPSKRMAIVNHAIALKELGLPDEMESVLCSVDWRASSLEYKLVLHALRNEEEEFYSLLPRAKAAGVAERWQLEEWPAFAHQRGTERFSEALERHFPSDEALPSSGSSEDNQ